MPTAHLLVFSMLIRSAKCLYGMDRHNSAPSSYFHVSKCIFILTDDLNMQTAYNLFNFFLRKNVVASTTRIKQNLCESAIAHKMFTKYSLNILHCIFLLSPSGVFHSWLLSFLQPDSAWHIQNNVHGDLEAEQLHLAVEQGLFDGQPHLMCSRTSVGANLTSEGTVTGRSDLDALLRFQPYSVGSN